MLRHYVCAVLPPDVLLDLPQRAKLYDLGGYQSFAADIKVDEITGQALRPWCVVAVEADATGHAALSADPDVWPLSDDEADKKSTRKFLSERGEENPPDTVAACLERSHPGAKAEALRSSKSTRVRPRPT